MAKCSECRGCMRLMRVEEGELVLIAWYCPFCKKAWSMRGRQPLVKEELDMIADKYKQVYGNKI